MESVSDDSSRDDGSWSPSDSGALDAVSASWSGCGEGSCSDDPSELSLGSSSKWITEGVAWVGPVRLWVSLWLAPPL